MQQCFSDDYAKVDEADSFHSVEEYLIRKVGFALMAFAGRVLWM